MDRPICDCCNLPMVKNGGGRWRCGVAKAEYQAGRRLLPGYWEKQHEYQRKYDNSLKGHQAMWREQKKKRQQRISENLDKLERLYEEG